MFLSNSSIAANGHRSQFQTQFYFRRSRTPPTSLSMPPPSSTVSLGHISDDGSFLDALGKFRWIAYDSIFVGVDILLVYLAADGFTSSYQQRLFRVQKTSMFDQMFWMCFFGTIFSGVWLICSGQLGYTLQYLHQYPKIGPDIVYLSLSSAFSQVAITYTIRAWCGCVSVHTDRSASRVDCIECVRLSRVVSAFTMVRYVFDLLPPCSAAVGSRKSWRAARRPSLTGI